MYILRIDWPISNKELPIANSLMTFGLNDCFFRREGETYKFNKDDMIYDCADIPKHWVKEIK